MSEAHPVGVLVSGAGTNLEALLLRRAAPADFPRGRARAQQPCRVRALDSWRVERAVPAETCRSRAYGGDVAARDRAMLQRAALVRVELVVCAGYDRLLSDEFLSAFPDAILNVHPSLLPAFAGGMHAVEEALAHGVKVTGCTVQLLEHGEPDGGPIVLQAAVRVEPDDDADTLRVRIHEARVAPAAAKPCGSGAKGRLRRDGRRVRILRTGGAPTRPARRTGSARAAADAGPLGVSDKTGLVEFARGLRECGVELVATGGTRQALAGRASRRARSARSRASRRCSTAA